MRDPIKSHYQAMINRCYNPKHKQHGKYKLLGVCDRWKDPVSGYENFITDIGPKPSPRHSLDRLDNALGYFPGNVRWATRHQQQSNRSDNKDVPGVRRANNGSGWSARLQINGKMVLQKIFKNYHEAVKARKDAEALYANLLLS